MDFEPKYTEEQERFRGEVREWLNKNMPSGIIHPADSIDLTYEQYQKRRDLGRLLGTKGWLWPTAPVKYGGGGLTMEHAVIIQEEVHERGLTIPPYYDTGGRLGGEDILVWGTEEQKLFFLPNIMKGEWRTWQLLSEPEAGSDLANVKCTAIRDGEDYVINGQKMWVGSSLGCEYMWTLTVTDPEAPRHQNLGWFMIPADLTGITIQPMELLISGGEGGAGSGEKNTVFFDNVRVPAFNLIGGENEGWTVATTHLELEHGAGGRAVSRNPLLERLFDYCHKTKRRGQPLTKTTDVRERLVDVYIEAEIDRLFKLRNYWMRHSKKTMTYEGPQSSYYNKMSGLRQATAILDILGPASLTHDPEWGAEEGFMEAYQRSAIINVHPAGTADIQKVIMARRIGIGREVREKAGALA